MDPDHDNWTKLGVSAPQYETILQCKYLQEYSHYWKVSSVRIIIIVRWGAYGRRPVFF